MLVKDFLSGERIEKATAYKGSNGRYFRSQEAHDLWLLNKEYRESCIQAIVDVMGYKPKMKPPSIIFKKLDSDLSGYGFDVVKETVEGCTPQIEWALNNKTFNNETGKAMYVMAIISNNAMEYYKKSVARKKMEITNKKEESNPDIDNVGAEVGKSVTGSSNAASLLDMDLF